MAVDRITGNLSEVGRLPDEHAIGVIDPAYTDVHNLLNRAEDQLTPVFIAAARAFLLNFFMADSNK